MQNKYIFKDEYKKKIDEVKNILNEIRNKIIALE